MPLSIGHKIRLLRLALGESQAVFGDHFGVEQATVSRWEAGGPVQRKYQAAVADLAGMTVAEFFHSRQPPRLIPIVGAIRDHGLIDFVEARPGSPVQHIKLEHGEHGQVAVRVRDDSMSPVYRAGDVLIGRKLTGMQISEAIGKDCIIRTLSGDGHVRILRAGGAKHRYSLRAYNPATPDIDDVQLAWAAPIVWIGRGTENMAGQ
jgi:transcriptional regulator with XRE-family HTH domain